MRDKTSFWIWGTLRAIVVAAISAIIVIILLNIIFGGRTAQQQQTLTQQRDATLALACELQLPVTSTGGRDPKAVAECFTQYHLTPPKVVLPRG